MTAGTRYAVRGFIGPDGFVPYAGVSNLTLQQIFNARPPGCRWAVVQDWVFSDQPHRIWDERWVIYDLLDLYHTTGGNELSAGKSYVFDSFEAAVMAAELMGG